MSSKTPSYKPVSDDYAIIAACEAAIGRGLTDDALTAVVRLHLANLKVLDIGTASYTTAVYQLGKLVLEIKKSKGTSSSDKAAMLNELMDWIGTS